ncbi:hypothetical protein SPFM12_00089 [Salmonella phage SPFM12]|nr:hypothetical protein SPFM12_00089 [Salmonella phage SPFM12]
MGYFYGLEFKKQVPAEADEPLRTAVAGIAFFTARGFDKTVSTDGQSLDVNEQFTSAHGGIYACQEGTMFVSEMARRRKTMTQIFDEGGTPVGYCLYRVIAGVLKIQIPNLTLEKLLAGNRACVALVGLHYKFLNHQRTILHIEKGAEIVILSSSSDLTEAQNKQLSILRYSLSSQVKAHLGIQLMASPLAVYTAKLYR